MGNEPWGMRHIWGKVLWGKELDTFVFKYKCGDSHWWAEILFRFIHLLEDLNFCLPSLWMRACFTMVLYCPI